MAMPLDTEQIRSPDRVKRAFRRGRDGFTLLEIIVVVIILSLLAGLIVPRFLSEPEKAKVAKARMQIVNLESALKMFKLDNGFYPTTEQGLTALVETPSAGKRADNWRKGGYLERKKVPRDPWGNDFIYKCPGDNGDFDLVSLGADGEEGGEEQNSDIKNWEIE